MDINYYKQFEPIDGKWFINKELGRGAFGAVYEVERHDYSEMKSAMKIITIPSSKAVADSFRKENYSMSDNMVKEYYFSIVQEYIKEFQLMSKLKGNSNIVSYEDHDVRERDDYIGWDIFIRMELLKPMSEYFQNHYTEKQVIKLGIDICKALEVCQKYNIIHRDIKPTNIFVSQTGEFKLGDFGVARILEKTTSHLSTKGTYTYMAPEVCRGERYTAVADIYSLGIVMYKLMNNNLEPFRTSTVYGEAQKALELRLSGHKMSAPANADARLSEIILRACEFDPKNRYQTPGQMRKRLESLIDGTYVTESYSNVSAHQNPQVQKPPLNTAYNHNFNTPSYQGQNTIYQPSVRQAPPAYQNRVQSYSANMNTQNAGAGKIKKNRKKSPLIISAILTALICLGGAVFGVYLNFNTEYLEAEKKLKNERFDDAKAIFKDISWYKDSSDKILLCDLNKSEYLMDNGNFDEAIEILEKLKDKDYSGADNLYYDCIIRIAEKYNKDGYADKALELVGKIAQYKDKEVQKKVKECKFDSAMLLFENKQYEQARDIFKELSDKNMTDKCDYHIALDYKHHGEYANALSAFAKLKNYSDSKEQFEITERWLINENMGEDVFSSYEMLEGKYSNEDGFYVEYSLGSNGSTDTSYTLPHDASNKYFKLEDGVHYHGNDGKNWKKQWIFEKVSSDTFNVYNYKDGKVYILERE